jgi:hypothetical protein
MSQLQNPKEILLGLPLALKIIAHFQGKQPIFSKKFVWPMQLLFLGSP